eukprot:5023090-Amphidinium_carterae.1
MQLDNVIGFTPVSKSNNTGMNDALWERTKVEECFKVTKCLNGWLPRLYVKYTIIAVARCSKAVAEQIPQLHGGAQSTATLGRNGSILEDA